MLSFEEPGKTLLSSLTDRFLREKSNHNHTHGKPQCESGGGKRWPTGGRAGSIHHTSWRLALGRGQVAAGAADDPVALLAWSVTCPIVVCPAMNDAMWEAKAVAANVATLRERGVEICGPVTGHLAEGYDAIGRMVEPEAMLERLLEVLQVQ